MSYVFEKDLKRIHQDSAVALPPGICFGSYQGHFCQLGSKGPEDGCADCPALMSQEGCIHSPVVILAFDFRLGHQQQQVLLGCLVYDGIKGLLQNLPHHQAIAA